MKIGVSTAPPDPHESCKTSITSRETQYSSICPTRRIFASLPESPYLCTELTGFVPSSSWIPVIVFIRCLSLGKTAFESKVRSSLDVETKSPRLGIEAFSVRKNGLGLGFVRHDQGSPRAVSRPLLNYPRVGRTRRWTRKQGRASRRGSPHNASPRR